MIREVWIVTLAFGLCAGLASGCAGLPARKETIAAPSKEVPASPTARTASAGPVADSAAVAAMPPSPYHMQAPPQTAWPPQPVAGGGPQVEGAVQPAALYSGNESGEPSPLATPVQPEPFPPIDQPRPVQLPERQPVVRAFESIIQNHPEEAMVLISYLDRPTQDMLLVLLPALARVSEGNLDKATPQDLAHLLAQIDSARAALTARAPLVLERMCYCRDLDHARFGVYQPLPGDHPFRPNEFVEVYAELRNFTSERHGQHYEVHLDATLEIRDSTGKPRWELKVPDRGERSQSPRHDHFVGYRFCVPDYLRGALYTLHVRVRDVPTGRTAERSLDLNITTRPIHGP